MKKLSLLLVLVLVMTSFASIALAENELALKAFDEPVTVKVMRESSLTIWFPEGESYQKNVLTDFYKEKLNIDYDVAWITDNGHYKEQVDLAIASNDLPDIFEVDPQQLYRLAMAGQIQPLGEVYEKYGSDKVKAALGLNDNMFFDQATVNGEMYGLPEPNDFADGTSLMWIRQDWLDYMGLTAPTNVDELEALALKFMEGPVDEAGNKALFGIGLSKMDYPSNNFVFRGMSHPYDAYFDTWIPDGEGGLEFSDVQPEVKDYLAKMNDWYTKGIFDPEFAVKEDSKVAEDIGAGRIGIMFAPFWAPLYPLNISLQNNEEAQWIPYPILPKEDGTWKASAWNSCKRYLVVRTGFEHPEAAVLGNNLWHELWQGDYAEYYHGLNGAEYAEAGEDFKIYPPFWFDPPTKNIENGRVIRELWPDPANEDKIASPELKKQWVKMQDYWGGNKDNIVGWAQWNIHDPMWQVFDDYYADGTGKGDEGVLYDGYTGPVTNDIARRLPLLQKLRNETFVAFIMGSKSLDEWDNYTKEWFDIGGQDMYNDVNEWFKNK
ncbi:extracellular solute-binding protein [Eubacteriales bacterium OttesenSCG-928-N13]|nr:extracellular solute-binding protein [Eubacteriales bacterium OttesenSCG-928-N13]